MQRNILGGLSGFALLALGCQNSPVTIQTTDQAIINGTADNIASHSAVVALTDNTGFAFCSGTYVGGVTGKQTIVSAGHCLEGGAPAFIYFGANANTDADSCINGNNAACDHFFPVTGTSDPGFNGQTLVNDLSVISFDPTPSGPNGRPLLNGVEVTPMPYTRFADASNLSAADEGDAVSFSGFGVTNGTNQTGGGVKLVVSNIPLVAVGPDNATGIDANQVFYNQPVNIGGPCNGDSGGPMFVKRGGQDALAAVTSFGDQTCSQFGVSTRVDQFDDFIEAFCGASPCGDAAAPGGFCGDGQINAGEQCDGANVGGQSCTGLGFDGGTLSCNANCTLNTNACTNNGNNEICSGGADEDGDGFVDCNDADCLDNPACQAANQENCDDGIDNDADGSLDCLDTNCASSEICQDQGFLARRCSVQPIANSNNAPLAVLFALFGLSLFVARRRTMR